MKIFKTLILIFLFFSKTQCNYEVRSTFRVRDYVNAIDISPTNNLVAIGFHSGTIELCEISSGRRVGIFSGHSDCVRAVKFSNDERFIASGGDDRRLIVWDLNGNQIIKFKCEDGRINSLCFSPCDKFLAFNCEFACLGCFDLGQECVVWFSSQPVFPDPFINCSQVLFSPSGRRVASICRPSLQVCDSAAGNLKDHKMHDYGEYFSLSCSSRNEFYVANVEIFPRSVCKEIINVLNVLKNTVIRRFEPKGTIYFVELSPDSRYLASLSLFKNESCIYVWDLNSDSNEPIFSAKYTVEVEPGEIYPMSLKFSRDDRYLVVVFPNGEVRVLERCGEG